MRSRHFWCRIAFNANGMLLPLKLWLPLNSNYLCGPSLSAYDILLCFNAMVLCAGRYSIDCCHFNSYCVSVLDTLLCTCSFHVFHSFQSFYRYACFELCLCFCCCSRICITITEHLSGSLENSLSYFEFECILALSDLEFWFWISQLSQFILVFGFSVCLLYAFIMRPCFGLQ